jgi:hypothetical protein
MSADNGTDTATDKPRIRKRVLAAFGAPILTVAGASFTETFHGLYDLMQRVEREGTVLSAVGPIGIDGLQLVALAGTYFLRRAEWHVRLYVWMVFLAANGVSVAGNVIDASARGLTDWGVRIAGVWPILLALASHIAIVSVRRLEKPTPTPAAASAPEPTWDEDLEPVSAVPAEPARPTEAQLRARARARYQNGASCRRIAADLSDQGFDVSEKKVERWTADIRRSRKGAAADIEPTRELEDITA